MVKKTLNKEIENAWRYEVVDAWRDHNPVPSAEKSLFSQIKDRSISFGERLAKRLEKQYGINGLVVQQQENGGLNQTIEDEKLAEFTRIPQYKTGGKMGNGLVLVDQPGTINSWQVNQEWLRLNVPYCTSVTNLAIVTGFGDSMRGMFNPGDPLLIDTGIKSLDSDGVYFFRVGNEGFIKRLQRIPGDGILVASSNKEYRDWFIKPEMDFEIFGRVLKAWEGKGF